MSSSSKNHDRVSKFLVPDNGIYNASNSRGLHGGSSGLRPSQQVPPSERGELKAFSTVSRGTSNILVPTDGPATTARSLEQIWESSLFGRAPQVASFPPEKFHSVDESGKVCVVRYLPERFERCRVQRPELVEDFVDRETLHDDGARLMHPVVRRRIHDTEVNGKQGEVHLRECLRQKSKLLRTCLHNFPHGALGVTESPYHTSSGAYSNAEELRAQFVASQRRSKGGHAPPTTVGEVLRHL